MATPRRVHAMPSPTPSPGCHPGEGRDSSHRERDESWVPAFAGMTTVVGRSAAGRLLSGGQRLDQRIARRRRLDLPHAPDVLVEEMAGEAEGGARGRRAVGLVARARKAGRTKRRSQVGLGGFAADGAAGLGRDVGQVLGRAGGGAAREVEAEAELFEEGQLEAGERFAEGQRFGRRRARSAARPSRRSCGSRSGSSRRWSQRSWRRRGGCGRR